MGRANLALLLFDLILAHHVASLELVANYKYWKSTSSEITYDYSGNSRHGSLYFNYVVTDRGLSPNNAFASRLMSYCQQDLKEYAFTFWMLNSGTSETALRFRFYYQTTYADFHSVFRYDLFHHEIGPTPLKTSNISYSRGWNLHTYSFNVESDRIIVNIFMNLLPIQLTYSSYNTVNIISIKNINLYLADNALTSILIIYEMWIHEVLESISELSGLISSSNCPTSPTPVCLPAHGKYINKDGETCSSCIGRSESCDANLACITKSMIPCQYGLYDLATKECLFFCPNNSCLCPQAITNDAQIYNSFICTCTTGYKKISDNPPACISIRCLGYHRVGYTYSCDIAESGYLLDQQGEPIQCQTGFTQVSSNPIICINTSICIDHGVTGQDYTCLKCAVGYQLDGNNKCNRCESSYIQVSDEPFVCSSQIENCITHIYNGFTTVCNQCIIGYLIDFNGNCDQCNAGYVEVSQEPFICRLDIEHCEEYDQEGEIWKCKKCEDWYQPSSSGYCDECQSGYMGIFSDGLICKQEIEHCEEYELYDERFNCLKCDEGYALESELRCSLCDKGYISTALDYIACAEKISHCSDYNFTEGSLKCIECESGYILLSECKLEVPFCNNYSETQYDYLCESCQDGFKLSDGRCICEEGSYLISDKKCNECPAHCILCKKDDYEEVNCLKCELGFDLKEGECMSVESTNSLNNTITFVEKATQITQVAIIASVSVSMISLNLNSILSIIGTVELLSYILIYNLNIPTRVRSILEGISIFNIIPNVFEYFIPNEDTLDIERYKRVDIKNELFLINSGKILTILIIIMLVIVLLKIFIRCATKLGESSAINKYLRKMVLMLEWNFVIGYLIQVSSELSIHSLINLNRVSWNSIYSIIGFSISLLVLVINILDSFTYIPLPTLTVSD